MLKGLVGMVIYNEASKPRNYQPWEFFQGKALFIKWEYIIMFRRMFVAAAAVVFVAFGVIAGEHKGAITKYEAGTSLTIKVKKEDKTLKIAKDAKIDDAVAKKLGKIGDKGVPAIVITNDKDEVTEIKAGEKKAK